MPYLIDGHNLIPKLGLHLDAPDDELDLVKRLLEYCRARRTQVEVYFDGAPPGAAATRKSGAVTAHFVSRGSSADAAIEARLSSLGASVRNWTVVSSDQRVQRAAQAVHARSQPSEAFAREMTEAGQIDLSTSKSEADLSSEEVEEWLRLIKRGG
jgi:predicted RNA-binding protein with PIN domain